MAETTRGVIIAQDAALSHRTRYATVTGMCMRQSYLQGIALRNLRSLLGFMEIEISKSSTPNFSYLLFSVLAISCECLTVVILENLELHFEREISGTRGIVQGLGFSVHIPCIVLARLLK